MILPAGILKPREGYIGAEAVCN